MPLCLWTCKDSLVVDVDILSLPLQPGGTDVLVYISSTVDTFEQVPDG